VRLFLSRLVEADSASPFLELSAPDNSKTQRALLFSLSTRIKALSGKADDDAVVVVFDGRRSSGGLRRLGTQLRSCGFPTSFANIGVMA